MNKKIGGVIGFLALVVFVVTIFLGKDHASNTTSGIPGQAVSKLVTLKGYIALDVETYLKDARVVKILADNGLAVEATRIGSREMASKVVPNSPQDFFFPSGIVAGNQISDAAKKTGATTATYSPFYTPMVMASWKSVADVLVANGLAKQLIESGAKTSKTYTVNLDKLTTLMMARKRWSDLKDNAGYDVSKSILVSTTDVRKSNSAAMYLALTSSALNGGEVVSDKATARQIALKATELFKRQGYQENYVNGNFDDYVSIGMGKTPLAFIYENQMVAYAIAKKSVAADMVLMYPSPTIFNKVVYISMNERAKALGELFANNAELQKIAVEYGFRGSDPGVFSAEVKKTGLAISERISAVIDPPSYEVMAEMIDVVTQEFKQ